MKTIASAVRDILANDPEAVQALNRGILNLSAYARSIRPDVEQSTGKTVTRNSITLALSRTRPAPLNLPHIDITDISLTRGLAEIVYPKTPETRATITRFVNALSRRGAFVLFNHGMKELAVTAPEDQIASLKASIPAKPELYVKKLATVRVHLAEDMVDTPNVFYRLMRPFVTRGIAMEAITSTATEIAFLVSDNVAEEALALLIKQQVAPTGESD